MLCRRLFWSVTFCLWVGLSNSRKYCKGSMCLVGGNANNEGNVEINGKGVCDDSWGMEDAAVVCRVMGFPGVVRFSREAEFGNTRTIGYDDVMCKGDELSIDDCIHSGQHDCSWGEAAGVVCATEVADIIPYSCQQLGKICLVGGPDKFSGNVYFEGRPICDVEWDFADAFVACKHLGFGPALNVTKGGAFGNCLDYFAMYSVNCKGNETAINQCSHNWDSGTCKHTQVAGAICTPVTSQTSSSFTIWLVVVCVCLVVGLATLGVIFRSTLLRRANLLRETSYDDEEEEEEDDSPAAAADKAGH